MAADATFDAVVIGAGHNGLVCAAYLARAGLSVKVVERREVVGGAAVTEEFHPGFQNSVCAYTVSLLESKVISDLRLADHGLRIVERPLANFLPLPDGRSLSLHGDLSRDRAEVAQFSAADGDALADYSATLDRLADVFRRFVLETPPEIGGTWIEGLRAWGAGRRLKGLGIAGLRDLADIATLSAADFLGRWFDSDPVKALFAFDGVVGTMASPYTPGTAYVLLHHAMGQVNGRRGAWGHALGGMGAISGAMAKAAEAAGAEIEVEAPVAEVETRDGRATAVRLVDGRRLRAPIIAAAVNPKLLFTRLVDPAVLDTDFQGRMQRYRCRSGTLRMNVALSEAPNFTCRPGIGDHLASGIVFAPGLDYMDAAFEDARGGWSRRPVIELLVPSLLDDSLAPPGHHVASLFCQHFDPDLASGTWDDARDAAADAVIDTVTEFAPNFKASILGRHVLTPLDLEREFGLTGGDIFHGSLDLNQLYSLRPVLGHGAYRMPIKGLYLCGAGAHPGGGVSGAPGHNAAREILRDRRWPRRRWKENR